MGVKMDIPDALRAAAISAYWEGFADGAKAAALRAKDAQIHEMARARKAPPAAAPTDPDPQSPPQPPSASAV